MIKTTTLLMPITFNGRFQSFNPLYNDHIRLPEDFWQYAERHNTEFGTGL